MRMTRAAAAARAAAVDQDHEDGDAPHGDDQRDQHLEDDEEVAREDEQHQEQQQQQQQEQQQEDNVETEPVAEVAQEAQDGSTSVGEEAANDTQDPDERDLNHRSSEIEVEPEPETELEQSAEQQTGGARQTRGRARKQRVLPARSKSRTARSKSVHQSNSKSKTRSTRSRAGKKSIKEEEGGGAEDEQEEEEQQQQQQQQQQEEDEQEEEREEEQDNCNNDGTRHQQGNTNDASPAEPTDLVTTSTTFVVPLKGAAEEEVLHEPLDGKESKKKKVARSKSRGRKPKKNNDAPIKDEPVHMHASDESSGLLDHQSHSLIVDSQDEQHSSPVVTADQLLEQENQQTSGAALDEQNTDSKEDIKTDVTGNDKGPVDIAQDSPSCEAEEHAAHETPQQKLPALEAIEVVETRKVMSPPMSPPADAIPAPIYPQRTPAKKLLAEEAMTMRSTSDKENEQPFPHPVTQDISEPAFQGNAAEVSNKEEDAVEPPMAFVSHQNGLTGADEPSPEQELVPISEPDTEATKPFKEAEPIPSSRQPTKTKPTSNQSLKRTSTIDRPNALRKSVATKMDPPPKPTMNRALSTKKPLSRPSSMIKPNVTKKDEQPTKALVDRTKAPVAIPHSKPRPVSLSFPTPPPRPKSSKPPTRPTFQLPGEAVAAKLKAAREERLKKEEEDQAKRPSFNPPPPPKSTKPPTKPTFQLPGEAIAAKLKAAREERMKKEEEEQTKRREFKARPVPKMPETKATVRPTAASRARESLILGRESVTDNRGEPTATLRRASSVREVPASSLKRASSVRELTAARNGLSVAASKRSSTIPPKPTTSASHVKSTSSASSMSKRTSVGPAPTTALATGLQRSATSGGTKKGKEVFNRATAEKEALEKQKRDKEDAARKARADAAERGRIASREWAEKMKAKMLSKGKKDGAKMDALGATVNATGL